MQKDGHISLFVLTHTSASNHQREFSEPGKFYLGAGIAEALLATFTKSTVQANPKHPICFGYLARSNFVETDNVREIKMA